MFDLLCRMIIVILYATLASRLPRLAQLHKADGLCRKTASNLCFALNLLLDTLNRSRTRRELLGQLHDQTSRVPFFRSLLHRQGCTDLLSEWGVELFWHSSASLARKWAALRHNSGSFRDIGENLLFSAGVTCLE